MKQVTVAAIVCAALGVCSLRAETTGTESNYDRLVREGRNVWRFKPSANNNDYGMLAQTNALGQWAFSCKFQSWKKFFIIDFPGDPWGNAEQKAVYSEAAARAGFGVLDFWDVVIVNADDTIKLDFTSDEGPSWRIGILTKRFSELAVTDFRCNRLDDDSGYYGGYMFGDNTNLLSAVLGGPTIATFPRYGMGPSVTNLTIIAAPDVTSFADRAFEGTWGLQSLTFDDLPKLERFPSWSIAYYTERGARVLTNWRTIREVVFLGKPFNAACMTNLFNGLEMSQRNNAASSKLSGDTPCRVYVSKRQWPHAERMASGYWKPATAEAGLTNEELARKPKRCLGIIDVSDANGPHRAWVLHRDSPYDEKRPGFCVLVR